MKRLKRKLIPAIREEYYNFIVNFHQKRITKIIEENLYNNKDDEDIRKFYKNVKKGKFYAVDITKNNKVDFFGLPKTREMHFIYNDFLRITHIYLYVKNKGEKCTLLMMDLSKNITERIMKNLEKLYFIELLDKNEEYIKDEAQKEFNSYQSFLASSYSDWYDKANPKHVNRAIDYVTSKVIFKVIDNFKCKENLELTLDLKDYIREIVAEYILNERNIK